jgi:(p)ppGpp synthase/HD superfamily hydrolase
VNAVTSIEKEYESIIEQNPDEPLVSLDKSDLDEDTVEKLINVVSNNESMIFALYIKAADRMHNLRTLGTMPYEKRAPKILETQQYYIPVLKRYWLNAFVPEIEDLCWQAHDTSREKHALTTSGYQKLLLENSAATQATCELLQRTLENIPAAYYSIYGCEPFAIEFKKREYTALEVYNMLIKEAGEHGSVYTLITKNHLNLFDLSIILHNKDESHDVGSFLHVFMGKYREVFIKEGIIIVDFGKNLLGKKDHVSVFVDLEDKYRNKIRLHFYTLDAYNAWMHGMFRGIVDVNEDGIADETENVTAAGTDESIIVKKRNGESLLLPKGSTALDFAFVIHEDIGLTAKGAKVNKQQTSIFKELEYGDEVVIIADSGRGDSESKEMVYHARIDWLNHVRTQRAKRRLTRFLQDKYHEHNPQDEYIARTKNVTSVTNRVYESIKDELKLISNE